MTEQTKLLSIKLPFHANEARRNDAVLAEAKTTTAAKVYNSPLTYASTRLRSLIVLKFYLKIKSDLLREIVLPVSNDMSEG